jgi:hypothetical protein
LKSVAEKCLEMTSLFEAELLVRLMLRNWGHPFAENEEFAEGLLEDASEALRYALRGEMLIEGVPPASLNLVPPFGTPSNVPLIQKAMTRRRSKQEKLGWPLYAEHCHLVSATRPISTRPEP